MFDKIIAFSVRNPLQIALGIVALIGWGLYSAYTVKLDAVPDITTNQVQVVTSSPALAAQEVEQFITYPVELEMANLQAVEEIRSISRYGLSIVTIVFDDDFPLLDARQLVSEQLTNLSDIISPEMGIPELMPISTGLGEVYQYTLEVDSGYSYSAMELRTMQDWLVKRQLSGIPGVVEINSFGGYLKQYEIAVSPDALTSYNLTLNELFEAVATGNGNTGGSYLEKEHGAFYIRTEGLAKSAEDIQEIVIKHVNGIPVTIAQVAQVREGSAPRFGAMTKNGEGEAVGGIIMMLKGENAYAVVKSIEERVAEIASTLPEGVRIEPYLNRADLVDRVIATVRNNLLEGGLIVIFILILLLGNLRAGLLVSSVIPLSMLFAFGMMNLFGVSANLMSLGAVDFGIVVDGSVIIVEAILHALHENHAGKKLSKKVFQNEVIDASKRIRNSAAFAEIIILVVYLPILVLGGIEGKTFTPMAQTVSFAILGAFLLSMTYVPMMSALVLKRNITVKETFADRLMSRLRKGYTAMLEVALNKKAFVISGAIVLFVGSLILFTRLGAVFIPTLGEGDLAMQLTIPPGGSLQQSIHTATLAERRLIERFPEVKQVVSKIGTAEVPTDPMAMENSDIMIILKPSAEWTSAQSRDELVDLMKESLEDIPGAVFEFTQPIQLRFNELITGSKSDLAVKIYGDDLETLALLGEKSEKLLSQIQGAADVKAEQLTGLPQLVIRINRNSLAKYGLTIDDVNRTVKTAFAGSKASVIYEQEKRFDLVVRLNEQAKTDEAIFSNLYLKTAEDRLIPVSEVAQITYEEGPMQISRDDTKRRVTIGVNVRDRDVKTLVEEAHAVLEANLDLPPGYRITYGGTFENLQSATDRLLIAVPVALLLIFILLYFAFDSFVQAILIFVGVPLSSVGGILGLWLRDMPFSISAGIGFIALFGVAVLNGIVMIAGFNNLKKEGVSNLNERILRGAGGRLRPILMTASVAALGFVPMAFSTSDGAEVQQPLATVVIAGLISASFLTLFVLPSLYALVESKRSLKAVPLSLAIPLLLFPSLANAQDSISLDSASALLFNKNLQISQAELKVKQAKALKQQGFQLGLTQFNWQRGQMNTAAIDNNFSVQQDFGNPFQGISATALAKQTGVTLEAEKQLTEKELLATMKTAYVQSVLWMEQLQMLQEQGAVLNKLSRLGQVRADAGEITGVEALMIEQQASALKLNILSAERWVQASLIRFNVLLNEDSIRYIPLKPVLTFPRDTLNPDASGALPVVLERERLKQSEKALKMAKTGYAPRFSAGYFNQQLDGVNGFQGFNVGVAIPLWFRPQTGATKQAGLVLEIQKNQVQLVEKSLDARITVLRAEFEFLLERLRIYEETELPRAERLSDQAELMLQSGEMSPVETITVYRSINQTYADYFNSLRRTYEVIYELESYQP
jgi:cobalt-zinc-cadmium resistance protein CzcA